MIYRTFSNLQLRALHENFFQIIHIDLRCTGGEKLSLVSAGITRFVLMPSKASDIYF